MKKKVKRIDFFVNSRMRSLVFNPGDVVDLHLVFNSYCKVVFIPVEPFIDVDSDKESDLPF